MEQTSAFVRTEREMADHLDNGVVGLHWASPRASSSGRTVRITSHSAIPARSGSGITRPSSTPTTPPSPTSRSVSPRGDDLQLSGTLTAQERLLAERPALYQRLVRRRRPVRPHALFHRAGACVQWRLTWIMRPRNAIECGGWRATLRRWHSVIVALLAPTSAYRRGQRGDSGVALRRTWGPRPSLTDGDLRAKRPFPIPANPATPAVSMCQRDETELSGPVRARGRQRARISGNPPNGLTSPPKKVSANRRPHTPARPHSLIGSPCPTGGAVVSLSLVWKHAPWLVVRPCLPDQGALRCIVAGTGAVPTDNVTLLSTRES